jgi:hypothetical protein
MHFQRASKKVFNVTPYIHEKYYGKFLVFEDDLRERGISGREYADTVVKMMEKFVYKKNWKSLPLNVFMCDWVLEKFMKVHNSSTISIKIDNNIEDVLLQDELNVARTYISHAIGREPMKFSSVVEELKPVLSKEWLLAYYTKHGRPIRESLEILSEEYSIIDARTYNDIIGAL